MPFDRLANVTPAAHKAFEHAFEHTLGMSSQWYEIGWEHAQEQHFDPEYAETQEYRDIADLIHWRMSYFDGFCATYRKLLGTHRSPVRHPVAANDVYPDAIPF